MNSKNTVLFSHSFISDVFLPALTSEQQIALALKVRLLISSPPVDVKNIFQAELLNIENYIEPLIEGIKLSQQYLTKENSNVETLNPSSLKLITDIQKSLNQKIRKYHACAFVCATLQTSAYQNEFYNRYQLLILLSASRLASIGEHDSAIHDVLSEFRQLAKGKRDDLAKYLPDATNISFEHLVERLDILRVDHESDQSTKNCLSHYAVPFSHAYNQSKGITRKNNNEITLVSAMRFDEDIDDYSLLKTNSNLKASSNPDDAWLAEEENNAPELIATFLTNKIKAKHPEEKYKRAHAAKAATERIKVRDQSLACDYKILTIEEIQHITCSIIADINQNNKKDTAITLLLCLLGSCTPKELELKQKGRKTKFKYDQQKKQWKLQIKHKVSTQNQKEVVRHLITEVNDYLNWFVPLELSSLFPKDLSLASHEECKKYLSSLNKKHGTRLNCARIASYFTDFCNQNSIDRVISEVVSSDISNKDSGVPYAHITEQQIQNTLDKFLEHIIKDFKYHRQSDVDRSDPAKAIGSPLVINNNEFIRVNELHIQQISALNAQMPLDIVRLHNHFVFYVYRMLTFASGYRPVTGTGGVLKDINFFSKQYWISDKENRDRVSARIIALPELVIVQIKAYIDYLKILKSKFNVSAPHIVERINHIIQEEEHLLFLVNDDNEIEEISPKSIKPFMDLQFPLPLNWHRHDMRSRLAALNISPALIAAFMGHENIGQESSGRYSGLSYIDLQSLAGTIETILAELHFKVVNIV